MPLIWPKIVNGFKELLDKIKLKQPPNGLARSAKEALILQKILVFRLLYVRHMFWAVWPCKLFIR